MIRHNICTRFTLRMIEILENTVISVLGVCSAGWIAILNFLLRPHVTMDYNNIKNNTMSDRAYHNIIMVKTTNAHTVILFLICRNSRIPF